MRWHLAGRVGPELTAVALIVVLAIAILLLAALGVFSNGVDTARPTPSPATTFVLLPLGRSFATGEVPSPDRPRPNDPGSEQSA